MKNKSDRNALIGKRQKRLNREKDSKHGLTSDPGLSRISIRSICHHRHFFDKWEVIGQVDCFQQINEETSGSNTDLFFSYL